MCISAPENPHKHARDNLNNTLLTCGDVQSNVSLAALQDAEEEVAVGTHEGRHSIGEDADSAFREAPPGLAHLDFGTRTGGGVVGPKLDRVLSGRQADKFEVKEGELLTQLCTMLCKAEAEFVALNPFPPNDGTLLTRQTGGDVGWTSGNCNYVVNFGMPLDKAVQIDMRAQQL